MLHKRTDLAVEAKELWRESAGTTTKLKGVEAWNEQLEGFDVETVKILDADGEEALGKPPGSYVTISIDGLLRREEDAFIRCAGALKTKLASLLDLNPGQTVLVVGLGNPSVTPDAVGPKSAANTIVTRHLIDSMPEAFSGFRPVCVFTAGVLGTTGIESAEVIRAVVDRVRPDRVIAVDALASRRLGRICRTLQLADTGITPGSGVGNSRSAVNRDTLGVPVIAIGVPTVVDAATLAADMASEAGLGEFSPEDFSRFGTNMIVTPKEIDSQITDLSKLIGYGINFALHDGITIEDIDMFLS